MLSRHSVGTSRGGKSSHATRQGTLGHSRVSSLSHCGVILAHKVEIGVREQADLHFKTNKKSRINKQTKKRSRGIDRGMNGIVKPSSKVLAREEKVIIEIKAASHFLKTKKRYTSACIRYKEIKWNIIMSIKCFSNVIIIGCFCYSFISLFSCSVPFFHFDILNYFAVVRFSLAYLFLLYKFVFLLARTFKSHVKRSQLLALLIM